MIFWVSLLHIPPFGQFAEEDNDRAVLEFLGYIYQTSGHGRKSRAFLVKSATNTQGLGG
jgi:hypothetical protein